jgi:exodeoxyribonuclease VII large subunit
MSEWTGLPFHDEPPPARAPRPLTVTELTRKLKGVVEGTFAALTVVGEISNCRRWSSGHIYFTLKDEQAQIRAVLFRTQARMLKCEMDDGLRVVVRGRLSVYEVKGEYQLVCDTIEPAGLGARQAAFEQLKRRLSAEGLFAVERKRPLPVLPRRIGVVTSLDGAAIRDILRILTSRYPGVRVVIRAARVQGEGASGELVRALRAIARVPDVDVVILGRGGGSAEDLDAFNDEVLARAIVACPVPVISAVGHEIDVTIADFVADVRAATPSNAAEIVVDRADSFTTRIERASQRLMLLMRLAAERRRLTIERADARLRRWPVSVMMRDRDCQEMALRMRHLVTDRLNRRQQRFQTLRRRLERRDVHRVAADLRARIVAADTRLRQLVAARQFDAVARSRELAARLDALSPLAVLGRGYAVCWNDARTSIIRRSSAVQPGDRVRVTLAEGELACRVESSGDR